VLEASAKRTGTPTLTVSIAASFLAHEAPKIKTKIVQSNENQRFLLRKQPDVEKKRRIVAQFERTAS